MADDVTLPGTGDIVAADEIAGKKHQRVKVQFGVDGSATDVSSSDPLPVTISGAATAAHQVTQNGYLDGVEGLLTTIDADTSALAGAVSGAEVQVDVVTMPAVTVTGVATSAKQDTAQTALDAIKTAVELLDNTVGGTELQVDVLTLPALPAGTNNIGDVDIASSVNLTANPSNKTLTTVTGTRSSSGDGTAIIAAPSAGNHVVIVNLEVNPKEATTTIILKSGSTAKRTWTLAQNSLYANDYPRGHELRMGSAAAIYLNLDADSDTNYSIDYFTEAD